LTGDTRKVNKKGTGLNLLCQIYGGLNPLYLNIESHIDQILIFNSDYSRENKIHTFDPPEFAPITKLWILNTKN
jgi:hypothetical protein